VAPPEDASAAGSGGDERAGRLGRTPAELFDDYLAERQVDDRRLATLFAELLEVASSEERAELGPGAEGADAA
jgi:hypothetical protein